MSDSAKDLAKFYKDNVLTADHSRSIGLFPIPEYPEFESGQGMWSEALDVILTTLRYLAPATLITLFWGQQSFLFKLLKHIDAAFRAIVFSSEEQKQEVLQWLAEAGPVRVEHLDTVWRHGWVLCGVLDAALPGACAGHPPTRLSLKHAQAIADHYLGVEPVFSRQELESNDSLSKHQEWKLATYLNRIRQALSKLSPPVSKPTSQRTSPETTQFNIDYVARGSGLTAAQINNKMHFNIYSTAQQSLDPGEITILIRGPKDTYGMTVIPPIYGKAQMIRQKLLGLQAKPTYTENALPITQGATYLRSYGKTDMNKTYFIPKSKYDIEIEEEISDDHARIGYVVNLEGKYEISITSRGQNIIGSPFTMTASKNIIEILETESFSLEDGEEIDIVDVKTDRKVVLRIVDFITEKMLLRENGTLEKISEDEAKILMSTDTSKENSDINSQKSEIVTTVANGKTYEKSMKFKTVVNKILKMNRVCKIIHELITKKELSSDREKKYIRPQSHQQIIPDIVNSTFSEINHNPFVLSDKRDKFIIPENISVSLKMEKSKPFYEDMVPEDFSVNTQKEYNSPNSLEVYESLQEQNNEDILTDTTSSNPFLCDLLEQNYEIEKDLGSFVKTEYEANNSQNEETDSTIKILVEDSSETPSPNNNPFIEPDVINMERPKTPILKIITGEIKDRDDSVYVDSKARLIPEEILGNEFINPFFVHHHPSNQHVDKLPIADFIIGAPVSLPPIIRAPTPEPNMESILITNNNDNSNIASVSKEHDKLLESCPSEVSSSVYSTPLHVNIKRVNPTVNSTFHSLDSNASNNVEIISISNAGNQETYQNESERNITPKKDMWDSAYVSIDDNNSSPDSNNNDNLPLCEVPSKQKISLSDNNFEFSNMGPAEREIWQTCTELKQEAPKVVEEIKQSRWEIKRPTFTPIIEESDRSISSSTKELKKSDVTSNQAEIDPVTVAFAELNNVYQEYFSTSDPTATVNKEYIQPITKHNNELNDISVNSASEISDVKRHTKEPEGKISEVQANVTESVSVSQTLRNDKCDIAHKYNATQETQFGDIHNSNIVLQRKQYWDNRIREIEAKSEENKLQQKKRRLSSRHLRHNDSLTKRRGKQIAKQFLSAGEKDQISSAKLTTLKTTPPSPESTKPETSVSSIPVDTLQTDTKLVERWKKYWDNKLETEKDETETTCFRAKSPKSKENTTSQQQKHIAHTDAEPHDISDSVLPVKQELPEEVFKAFETSPKRFFGTSRKQILNKIDTFLGKPSTVDESSIDVSGAHLDTGLVSSRISLFHKISNTEELPWARRKCQSMHNISQRKDSERSIASTDENVIESKREEVKDENIFKSFDTINDTHQNTENIPAADHYSEKPPKHSSLKDKRSKLVQKVYNKSFDETVHKKPHQAINTEIQTPIVKKIVNEYKKQNQHIEICKPSHVLRKSSISKSEMDIFNKTTNKSSDDDDLDKYKSCDELPKINVKSFISLYESVSKPDVIKPERKIDRTKSIGLQRFSSISSSSGAVHNTTPFKSTAEITSSDAHTDTESLDLKQSQRKIWKNRSQESIGNSSIEPKSIDSVDIDIVSTQDLEKETKYLSLSDIELEIVETSDKPAETSPKTSEVPPHIDYKSRFKLAKEFFQSLEELREVKPQPPRKLNECQMLLENKSTESLDNNNQPQKRRKKITKSHSMPSSEISKIWNQMQESQESNSTKLVKISEKFNVDDLFSDVMEGKLSRQGSLRGIPHKKAVLEAFRSMENLTDKKINSYEITSSEMNDFEKEGRTKNAQTYLNEYPYLPMTDPSKFQSRLDTKASGLISLKELLRQKPRRNSVPDLRLNPKFTENL